MAVYQPEEDSFFLSEQLKDYLKNKTKQIKILDTWKILTPPTSVRSLDFPGAQKPKHAPDFSPRVFDTKKIPRKNFRGAQESFRILDMGSGSGIQAETCLKLGFENTTAVDIDNITLENLKNKFKNKIKIVKSDLFSNIKDKFDLIIFNPPYLPENKYDKKRDTAGGKKGDETILQFLEQARYHLEKSGEILLLLSSLTPRTRINQLIKKYYKKQILAEKTIFFEKLEIWLLSPNLPVNNTCTNN